MANRACLIGHPSRDRTDIPRLLKTFNPDKHTLVAANYQVPVFWFTLFEPAHLINVACEGERIPIFVAPASVSRALLKKRRPVTVAGFPGCEEYWSGWEELIRKVDCETFILEMSEIWEIDPRRNKANAMAAARWFKSQALPDFKRLLELAGLKYKSRTQPYSVPAAGSLSSSLRGDPWVRKIPWKSEQKPTPPAPPKKGIESCGKAGGRMVQDSATHRRQAHREGDQDSWAGEEHLRTVQTGMER